MSYKRHFLKKTPFLAYPQKPRHIADFKGFCENKALQKRDLIFD